jgi:hypothetical protein
VTAMKERATWHDPALGDMLLVSIAYSGLPRDVGLRLLKQTAVGAHREERCLTRRPFTPSLRSAKVAQIDLARRLAERSGSHEAQSRSTRGALERRKRPGKPSAGDGFKPFTAASRQTAKAACDYTRWPEVKALPAVAVDRRTASEVLAICTTGGRSSRSWQADPRPWLQARDEEGRSRVHPPPRSGRPHVESTPGHYRVLCDGKPLRKANGMPFTLPFSPDTIRWRRAAIVELRKLGIDL